MKLRSIQWPSIVCLLCTAAAGSQAQTLTTFTIFDGYVEKCPLIQGPDGNFYVTTKFGGAYNKGSFNRIGPTGKVTLLYDFPGFPGLDEVAGVVLAKDGNFYGAGSVGGATGAQGAFFKFTLEGALTIIATHPKDPSINWPLIQATDGNFYGTGGANYIPGGALIRITPAGEMTVIHRFTNDVDGQFPESGLIQGIDGYLYGTTSDGGPGFLATGTVFKIPLHGQLTTLHFFDYQKDGGFPMGLMQAPNGAIYVSLFAGGDSKCGSISQITPQGTLTTVHTFNCDQNGTNPYAALLAASDGRLYGTTDALGAFGAGTIFQLTPDGTFSTLYSFPLELGRPSRVSLIQATDGNLYGTENQVSSNSKTSVRVYGLSFGLRPLLKTVPTSGLVGDPVTVIGSGLTGAASLQFNGTPAPFTVNSATEISTTVPAGATTGKIEVITPGGALDSKPGPFRVRPVLSSFSPGSGPVGTLIVINGQSLTGVTRVTFAGNVPTTNLTVQSDTQLTVTVPPGAKTGRIQVTSRGGNANSTAIFTAN